MKRRTFIHTSLLAALAGSVSAAEKRAPRILLRNGWQIENIGDIAHTPGLLALLEKHLPDAEITVWPFYPHLPAEEVAMLKRRFPKLRIVEGKLDEKGVPPAGIAAIMDAADFFLHGSGPATVGWREIEAFRKRTGKPFGVYGVTYGLYGTPEKALLSDAAFVYFRDSVSLEKAKQDGIKAPVMEFGPDAVFAVDVRDDARAAAYLQAVGLEEGKFLVCIPKQRITPVWQHKLKARPFNEKTHARNEAMKEHDHAPLLEAITLITRQTGMKVLIGHEDEVELPIGKEWLLDQLPADVRAKCVWRDTLWDLEEAVGIYAKSAGMFSNEMHSPIMCIALGIPAIVCRWAEQSSKGMMWRDIGLGDWLFDFDNEDEVKRMPGAALAIAKEPAAAKAKAVRAREFVNQRFNDSMAVLKKGLGQ
ncbi:polysaccharide pyruvyl transferase family protein [bacterium]|nr:polysaccharide pyruvyl transferase family protein [bacterium]